MSFSVYGLLLICFIATCTTRDLPPYFPKCRINDEKLNDCILNATRILKPDLAKGIKEINLPPLNPLVVSSLSANQSWDNFRYNVTFENFTVHGLEDYDIHEIKYDPTTLVLNGKVKFNNVLYSTNYKLNGWIFYFPIVGEGNTEAKMDSVNGTFEINGKLIVRKGKEYYRPISVDVRVTIKGFAVHFKGLFDNNSELEHLTNELLNINAQRIADAATPALETLIKGFLMNFVDSLTKLVPYNKLFPHS